MNRNNVFEKLDHYNQNHLLRFDKELSDCQKQSLLKQIEKVDFSVLTALTKNESDYLTNDISPICVLKKEEIDIKNTLFRRKGIEAIKNNKVGVVLLAGGQGSRLGFDKPKGILNIGIKREYSLFQHIICNLKKIADEADNWIYLFVMTSPQNDNDIRLYFKNNNYFGYDFEYIYFFKQYTLPSVDFNGKIIMTNKASLCLSPDGNGRFYNAFLNAGYEKILEKVKIEWLNVFSVDNVLQKIADPLFIGATITSNCNCGAKVVKKAFPDERVGLICLKNNKPQIIEYYELPKDLENAKDNQGDYLYNYGVILNYLFKVSKLEEIKNDSLPVHIAKKKIKHIDDYGKTVNPIESNAYKFEFLLTDMIKLMDTCLPFEVYREKEFAPIKNKTGIDSLETAQKLLLQNGFEI